MDGIWKDLSAWQKDVNKKDETLLRNKPVHNKVRKMSKPLCPPECE